MRLIVLFAVLFGLVRISFAQESDESNETALDRIRKDVSTLASEEFGGRFPGSSGGILAEDYIAAEFNNIGLKPFGSDFKHGFMFPEKISLGSENVVVMKTLIVRPGIPSEKLNTADIQWTVGEDWIPLSMSESGSVSGDLVFCGFGITAPEIDYDDYAGIDLAGKIPIVLTQTPDEDDPDSPFFKYYSIRSKIENAKAHGATGIIFVKKQHDSSDVLDPILPRDWRPNAGIVAIQANRTSISKFFPRRYSIFPTENQIVETKKPMSFDIPNVSTEITVDLQVTETAVSNIVGYVKGTDPDLGDDFLLISANFDHLGYDDVLKNRVYFARVEKMHPGANDNASGVAAMLELARSINSFTPPISVVFVAFNAEEFGNLGSEAFVENPPIDLDKIRAHIQLKAVGALGPLYVKPWDSAIPSYANFNQSPDQVYFRGAYQSFAKKGVPSLLIFGDEPDYRFSPDDTVDKINFKHLNEATDAIKDAVYTIASSPDPKIENVPITGPTHWPR